MTMVTGNYRGAGTSTRVSAQTITLGYRPKAVFVRSINVPAGSDCYSAFAFDVVNSGPGATLARKNSHTISEK